jgi:hypothetical protein
MKKSLILFFINSISLYAAAQLQNYSCLTIPDSMKKNANVVLRDEYIKLTVKSSNSARYEVHDVFTVLNEQGSRELFFNEFSDKFRTLEDATIIVYDPAGKKTDSYSQEKMISINYGEGLVPEGKVTYFKINTPGYPITVEINYTIKYKGILHLPGYIFQTPWQSVQHSVFDIEVPAELGIRYKLLNTNRQPVATHDGNKDRYHWEVRDLVAYTDEKNSGSSSSNEPSVLVGPVKFQLDDYDGDMNSWKNFGKWINDLYLKTTVLPDERKAFYLTMVQNANTDIEKARILYSYMQKNMRYVSIQLGIGGWRPFSASFVDEKKYGDCKALSNYLRTALLAVGVKANVAIIEGGLAPQQVMEDFPADYFNHVILCIPQPKDSIWLECTSTTLPFAELGPFTENRKAMLITDSGGVLVNTPVSKYANNIENFVTHINVDEEGGAKLSAVYSTTGFQRDLLLMRFHDMKDDEKKSFFMSEKKWRQPDIINISSAAKTDNPYRVIAKMEYEKISSFSAGSKIFLEPRLYPIFDEDIPETEKRKRDYYFTCPYQATDTTVYQFPPGYSVESLPKNKLADQGFAHYNCSYNWDAATHTLSIIAQLQIRDRVIKAADYQKLLDFKKQVITNMNEKIVMKKD